MTRKRIGRIVGNDVKPDRIGSWRMMRNRTERIVSSDAKAGQTDRVWGGKTDPINCDEMGGADEKRM
ncbi:MAG: hypothetical protein HUJ73_05475 [Eubacterium sp.]|nr:hypothetical protein [Eubacterium sp.]